MIDFHTFEHDGRRFRLVVDEEHETRGSYGLATEAATLAAEDEELAMLASGAWVVLGCLVSDPCPHDEHCGDCSGWNETDSCWGIVVENSIETAETLARTMF
jgi:hypothetical protein